MGETKTRAKKKNLFYVMLSKKINIVIKKKVEIS